MEQHERTIRMLDLLTQPAFCVQDGVVTAVNQSAQQRLISVGTPIQELLRTGLEEYNAFSGDRLYLTLTISGEEVGASVIRIEPDDIFRLDIGQEALRALSLAARELRTPLANVMLVADQLFPALPQDKEMQYQAAQINRGLFQLLRLVGNMDHALQYAQRAPDLETKEVCGFLMEIFSAAQELAAQADIRLDYQGLTYPLYCLIDVEALERAVHNILSNAIKFSPKGSTVTARLTRHGDRLFLTVQDCGSGISPHIRDTVFVRYLREPCIEEGRLGLGLGMVLIRAAATFHDGTVLLEHPEEGGLRLTMTIAIRKNREGTLREPRMRVDYTGDREHRRVELAEVLPAQAYWRELINCGN